MDFPSDIYFDLLAGIKDAFKGMREPQSLHAR